MVWSRMSPQFQHIHQFVALKQLIHNIYQKAKEDHASCRIIVSLKRFVLQRVSSYQ